MDQFDATGKNGQTDSKDVNQELDDLLANMQNRAQRI